MKKSPKNKCIINIIGGGKLGKTIAKLITINRLGEIGGVVNSSLGSSLEAVHFIGAGSACTSLNALPVADITFITTRDDLIATVASELQNTGKLTAGSLVVHCSGSLTADVLAPVKASGALTASIHPIKSFANPTQAVDTFKGTYCAIEGDSTAVTKITSLFEALGALVVPIDKTKKKIYHAGGVIANNYLVTLHHHATSCYTNAGLDESTAKAIVSMLMNDALNNLANLNHANALTGPLQRGDVDTLTKHIDALSLIEELKHTKDIYLAMAEKTIDLTSHHNEIKEQLRMCCVNA